MNSKNIFVVAAIGTMFTFASCKNETPAVSDTAPATEVVQPADATVTPAETAAPAASTSDAAPANSQQIQVTPANSAPAQTTPAGGSGKINPAHGQPGHSCAVPVGSPLPN